MYEHHTEPVLSFRRFMQRMLRSAAAIFCLILLSLAIGVSGYHLTEHMDWIDAFLNSSMILSGMGPAGDMQTPAGKIFASFYALYSGLFLIAVTGTMLIPVLHWMMHKFHVGKH